jgi:hypothetical protein
MSLAKMLLTAFVALSLAATASTQIWSATITGAVTDQSVALAADAEAVITNSGTNVSHKTRTTEARSGTLGATVEVAAQAAQIQADSSAVTNATNSQVINDVPNVTQNPLFYAMMQSGIQPRNETSTSTLGDL